MQLRVACYLVGDGERPSATLAILASLDADVVGIAEPQSGLLESARASGWHTADLAGERAVLSQLPIAKTEGIRADIRIGPLQTMSFIVISSDWSRDDLPNTGADGMRGDALEAFAWRLHDRAIQWALREASPSLWWGAPVVIAGAFGEPSHLDAPVLRSYERAVQWPVSIAMERSGLKDAIREIYPVAGRVRSQYIYFSGDGVRVSRARSRESFAVATLDITNEIRTPKPIPILPFGHVTRNKSGFNLHIFRWPRPWEAKVTGIAGIPRGAWLLDGTRMSARQTGENAIELEMRERDEIAREHIVSIDMGGPPQLVDYQPLVRGDQGNYLFYAYDATLHGDGPIRYDMPTGAVGYWNDPGDYLTWDVEMDSPGTYMAIVEYSCPEEVAGGVFSLGIGSEAVIANVESTGNWTTFRTKNVGTLQISMSGRNRLVMQCVTMKTGALMNVRRIRLVRVR